MRRHIAPALLLAVSLSTAARADLLNPTGNAVLDLPSSNSGVFVVQDRLDDVAQAAWMTQRGWTTGWNIQDLRVAYDQKTDTLTVGVNFVGIAGDADGNGNPGGADPLTSASGGLDLGGLGGRKSISVGFAPLSPGGGMGNPLFVAGVPAVKTLGGGGGIDGFTVAKIVGDNGLAYSYGPTIAGVVGTLLFDPSADHPDFVFTLAKVSTIAGFSPAAGYYVSAFAGSPEDVIAGEDTVPYTRVPGITPVPQVVPEPSSLLLVALGGAGLVAFRRRRKV